MSYCTPTQLEAGLSRCSNILEQLPYAFPTLQLHTDLKFEFFMILNKVETAIAVMDMGPILSKSYQLSQQELSSQLEQLERRIRII
jgi:hypothetical protein